MANSGLWRRTAHSLTANRVPREYEVLAVSEVKDGFSHRARLTFRFAPEIIARRRRYGLRLSWPPQATSWCDLAVWRGFQEHSVQSVLLSSREYCYCG